MEYIKTLYDNDKLPLQLKGQHLLSTKSENDNEKTLDKFDIQLGINPNNPEALFLKTYTLSELGRNDEAIDNYKRGIKENDKSDKDENIIDTASQYGENPSILMKQVIGLLRDESYPEALNKLDNFLKYDERNAKDNIGRA